MHLTRNYQIYQQSIKFYKTCMINVPRSLWPYVFQLIIVLFCFLLYIEKWDYIHLCLETLAFCLKWPRKQRVSSFWVFKYLRIDKCSVKLQTLTSVCTCMQTTDDKFACTNKMACPNSFLIKKTFEVCLLVERNGLPDRGSIELE